MPRKLNPGSLKTGHGKAAPDENIVRPSLTGGGLAGAGPNIGEAVDNYATIDSAAAGLASHVHDPKSAHSASAIEHDGHPDVLLSGNVEGALDELIGTVMEHPPYLGTWARHTSFSGIPDWGFLKLRDQSLEHFDELTNKPEGTDAGLIFPYYWQHPGPPQDSEFTQQGGDPRTDHLWNDGTEILGTLPGGGWGRTHNGGFTRDGDTGPAPLEVMRTERLYPRPTGVDGETGRPARVPVCVSGTIFPADRGVLALLHIPPNTRDDMQTEFLGQPLISDETDPLSAQGRVVAALLLGNGMLGRKCQHPEGSCESHPECDGGPGGIFAVGEDADGNHDPFAYPGRATGQYDLKEIHQGTDNVFAQALNEPFDDFDEDGNPGAARAVDATVPAPGQVRLGTDPDAGVDPVDNGIPVLGGTSAMYAVAPVAQNGSLTHPIHGDALVLDSNFFRYRLPVLADYSPETGVKWTPTGEDPQRTKEARRYFDQATPISVDYPDGDAVGAQLRSAGFYEGMFSDDYWVWQVARYRQSFLMPSIEVDGDREEVGTYWLVHFKREADFEKCIRDGIFPWDATDGYEVYGMSLASTAHVEEDGNIANEWPAATAPEAPNGPAPLYGYAADPYHQLRSTILMDPSGLTVPNVSTGDWDWDTESGIGGVQAYMAVSGVYYLTPRDINNGAEAFRLQEIDIEVDPGFWTSYRTDDEDLTGGTTAPAIIASMNPMFINNAPFAYDSHPTLFGPASSLDFVSGADPAANHIPSRSYQRKHRFELPYTFLGSNAGGVFTDTNGPLDADTLAWTSANGGLIIARGDDNNPSFSADAVMRAYFRRPLAHTTEDSATLPFAAADGHGYLLTPLTDGILLFHTTRFDANNKDGQFSNVLANPLGAPPNGSFSQLFTAEKDVYERFLDETYRLNQILPASVVALTPYSTTTASNIIGPGMRGWVGGPVEIPVRAALCSTPYDEFSWLLMEKHIESLDGADPEARYGLQVAGLPDRNPPISAGVEVPFPSVGLLMYPHKNYSVGYQPASGSAMIDAAVQPDYSAVVGDRVYVRAFDVNFSNHYTFGATPPVDRQGDTEVTLRFDGITLEDFLYSAPGPGGLVADRYAIYAKVPGLTTWMDVGRVDGGGPSKQDPTSDGAGCLIADGEKTYNFTDPVTGYKGCYVAIDVGPVASFFTNPATYSGYASGSPADEAPLLVKVEMNDGAADYALEKSYSTLTGFGGVRPGADPRDVRGLIGIRVEHPNAELLDPDETGQVLVLLP
jgi:hypothetical protein